MKQYQNLLKKIMEDGVDKGDRTGTGTRSLFGTNMRFDLQDGFPALSTKKVHMKSVIHELLWFLSGSTNIQYLKDNGVKIWDEWADDNGDLGPVYGSQWRGWAEYTKDGDCRTIDQIAQVIDQLKTNPDSRRHIVSAWNVRDIEFMYLPPCHLLFQFYSRPATQSEKAKYIQGNIRHSNERIASLMTPDRVLSCSLYQRSVDSFLGLPFNIASYALLTHMIAKMTGHMVGDFYWTGGDTHIYHNHFDQVNEILSRHPSMKLPRLVLNPRIKHIDDFKYDDIMLIGYNPQATISAPIAV